jgi:hypothetical protein
MRSTWAAAAAAIILVGAASTATAQADPNPPDPPEPAAPMTTIDADGTYTVGTDIQPGRYGSAGPVGDGACYWKRANGTDIVDNAMSKKAQVVEISPTDTTFTTNECQPWQLTDAPMPAQAGAVDILGQLGQIILHNPAPPN